LGHWIWGIVQLFESKIQGEWRFSDLLIYDKPIIRVYLSIYISISQYQGKWFGFEVHALSGLYHFHPCFSRLHPFSPTIELNMAGKTA
jgi:hypothetical protein